MHLKLTNKQLNNKNEDINLINSALSGDKKSLERLILKYKDWIFNFSIRMVISPLDAEDITQEIIIKIITHLNKYDYRKASFKTWLYRITVNHILNMQKRGLEKSAINFDNYYERMNFIEDRTPEDTPEINALIRDALTNCVMATLVCLDRRDRIVIIFGVIFNINSRIGAEILGLTHQNFRKILSRSRKKLKKFMRTTCSLVNSKAKCKCKMKITDLINHGYRNPEKLVYANLKYDKQIRDVVGGKVNKLLNTYFYKFNDLFQSQPYWRAPEITEWLNNALRQNDFKEIFNLD